MNIENGGKVILELDSRRKIYNYILENPGLHRRELNRKLGISYSNLRYHLHFLTKNDYITRVSEDGYVRYYIKNKVTEINKKLINLFRQELPRKIIFFLDVCPDSTLVDMAI